MQQELLPFQVYEKNRGNNSNCSICKREFKKLIHSEHQCKRCKRPICEQCGKNKVKIINYYDSKPHRICCICFQDHSFIKATIKNKKVKFGQDSILTREWVKTLEIKENLQQMQKNYQYYLQDYKNDCPNGDFKPFFKFKNSSELLLSQYEQSMNYSNFEFYHYASYENNVKQIDIRQQIEDLTGAIILKNPQFGFVPEFLHLVIFMLCFNSEETAFAIINKIIEVIYPESLYPRNVQDPLFDSRNQKKRFATLINTIAQYAKPEVFLITKFLDMYLNSFFPHLTLNTFNFQVSFYLFENIIKDKDILKIELALVSAISQQIQQIKHPDNNFFITHFNIVREFSYLTFKEAYSRYEFKNVELEPRALNKIEIDQDKKKYENQIKQSSQYKRAVTKAKQIQNINEELQEEKKQQEETVKQLVQQIQKHQDENQELLEQNKKQQQEIIRLNSLLNTNDQIQKTELKLNDQQEIISSQNMLLQEYKSLISQLKQKMQGLQEDNIKLRNQNENYIHKKIEKIDTTITSTDELENILQNIGDANNNTQLSVEGMENEIQQNNVISENNNNNQNNEFMNLKLEFSKQESQIQDLNLQLKDLQLENQRLVKNNITLKNQNLENQQKNQESLNTLQTFLNEKDDKIQQLKLVINDHECMINELKNEEDIKNQQILCLESDLENLKQTVNKIMDEEVDIFKIQSIHIDLEEALEELLENFDNEENIETVLQIIKEIYYSCEFQKKDNDIKREIIVQLKQKNNKIEKENQKYNQQLQLLTKMLDEKMDQCEEQNNVIEDYKFKLNQMNFNNSNNKNNKLVNQSFTNIF